MSAQGILAVMDLAAASFDAPARADAMRQARAAVAALIAERDALRDALLKLTEAADTSDDCQYGTLATGFVRDMARAALTAARAQGVQS